MLITNYKIVCKIFGSCEIDSYLRFIIHFKNLSIMTVLIAKINEPVIKEIFKKAVFIESTKNTSTFKLSRRDFLSLFVEVKNKGYNPYALMNW